MKKFLLSLLALIALTANAETTTTYEGTLTVKAMVIVTLYEGEDVIYVTAQDNGKYTLELKNFSFEMTGETLELGNIVVTDIDGTEGEDGSITLYTSQDITIQDGDDPTVDWSGPSLGEISVTINGTMTKETLSATITIPVGMDITVTFEGKATDTGIEAVRSDSSVQSGTSYTINGMKASEGYKGIVVKDGKKVLVK